jgi:hypothetical protein
MRNVHLYSGTSSMLVVEVCQILLILLATTTISVCAFSPPLLDHASAATTSLRGCNTDLPMMTEKIDNDQTICLSTSTRRNWINGVIAAAATTTTLLSTPTLVRADDTSTTAEVVVTAAAAVETETVTVVPLEMKEFIDPAGLFSLRVPKGFFTLRRTAKGDLPDSKTGKGRRGSSIFTAGNMAKAEVIAVERYPTRVLLEDNGIEATGNLDTFPGIGNAKAVANLIILRREKDAPNKGLRVLDSIEVTPDGKELTFRIKTEIDVQNPELLFEQEGISQLFRITVAKCSLNSDDGNLMAIFASALEQDFTNGVDGPALVDSVNSFQATKQSS